MKPKKKTGDLQNLDLEALWMPRFHEIQMAAVERLVTAGIHADAPEDVRNLVVVHEFGSRTVPARAPIATAIGAQPKPFADGLIAVAHAANVAGVGGQNETAKALKSIAVEATTQLQETIDGGLEPELQPATVAHKRRMRYLNPNTPLVATGEMRENMVGRVRDASEVTDGAS